ncbi:MAG TPA: hypothetical protein VMB26_11630 [Candidatus Binataceae bacterium]|nr:hypothetical protein [Candidatus Binataceae bacterium]
MDKLTQPAFIDFHDAVISSVKLHGDSSATISFENLNCFYAVGPDEYEVWACAADISCYGLRALELKGRLDSSVWVSHGSMLDAQQSEVLALSTEESQISSLSLTLLSGTEIRLSVGSARLETLKRLEQLEKWTGPLR